MELLLERRWKKTGYTIGRLFINGVFFSNTCEDEDRGLKQSMTEEEIRSKKIYGETAIPAGTYTIRMDIVSPKYNSYDWYRKNCNGRMPRLENVKGFSGILIHPGNSANDSYGCILVGENKKKGQVLNSKATFLKLWKLLEAARKQGETITIILK